MNTPQSPSPTPYEQLLIDVIPVASPVPSPKVSDRLTPVSAHTDTSSITRKEFGLSTSRHGRSLMLRFDLEGHATLEEMSRVEVLRMTHDVATVPLDADERDRQAAVARLKRVQTIAAGINNTPPFGTVIDVQRVHGRDIRKLDKTFSVSNEPSIELRNQAILINADTSLRTEVLCSRDQRQLLSVDPVRAIIMRTNCLVFVSDRVDTMSLILQEMFHEIIQQDEFDMPFELKALEALLRTLSRYFQVEYEIKAPMIVASLDRLASGKMSVTELDALREFKNTMNEFESQVDGVRRALMEILDNEEDLRLLYLTKLYEDPLLLQDLWSFDSEEAEVLIENYLHDIFSTKTKASLLQYRIQNTESLVMLKLDSTRNYLLGVDIFFSIVAIAISIGTFVSGIFGMNLNSGLEQADGWFWGVTIASFAIMIVLPMLGWLFFRGKGVFMYSVPTR